LIEESFPQSLDTGGLAKQLESTFGAEGYQVQELGGGDDIAVQIKKESTGRAIVGMQQAITVRMQKQSGITRVSVGQAKWADKAGVEVIGALVFWPLMIPATYGVYKQHTLPEKVLNVVNTYAASKGAGSSDSKTSSMIACPNCGVMNAAGSQYCSACGSSLKEVQKV
jgi:zinc-ribbon domain